MSRRIIAWLVHRWLCRNHGRLTLPDGTIAVRQSVEFNAYCYGPAYDRYMKGEP